MQHTISNKTKIIKPYYFVVSLVCVFSVGFSLHVWVNSTPNDKNTLKTSYLPFYQIDTKTVANTVFQVATA